MEFKLYVSVLIIVLLSFLGNLAYLGKLIGKVLLMREMLDKGG